MYEYIKAAYAFKPEVGHYVQVKFDGRKHASPCHPGELTYI